MSGGTHDDRSNQDKLTVGKTLSAMRLLLRLLIQKKTRRSVIEYSKNFVREKDSSPLHEAAKNGRVRTLRRLLDEGEYPDSASPTDPLRRTPLMAAAGSRLRRSSPKVGTLLLEKGADPNATDVSGRTALFYAVESDHLDFVEVLIGHGAHVNHSAGGMRPIHAAAMHASPECIRKLVDHGAHVNDLATVGLERRVTLCYAAGFKGDYERVKMLLRHSNKTC